MLRTLPLFLVAMAGLLLPSSHLTAQSVTVDEGVFRITVDGAEVGSETFAIRRSGTGADAQIIATAEIQMEMPEGALDLRPALQASGGDMAVSAYQIKVSGHRQEEVYVTLGDRRFRTSIRSERGEQEREYRATPGTVLLDTGVAHQYYFISSRIDGGNGSIPVIVPRESSQFDLTVTHVGDERIQIGGEGVDARHLRLEGNQETRELWVDSDGRVLRLEYPSGGYVAERERRP
jgi:hypothetical protein